jgi:hypothetical protein
MKNLIIKGTAIMGLFFTMAIANVQAQTISKAVNIPFDFAAGKAQLQAGTYTFKQRAGNVIAINDVDGKTVAVLNAPLTLGSRDSKPGERLVFNQYDNQYFLSQVWLQAESGKQLFTSAAEARTAREYRLTRREAKPKRMEVAVK